MAHAQKPDLVFQRNGWVHLYRRGCQFSRLLAAEVRGSAVVMLDRPCPTQCTTAGYPLHSPFSPSLLHPCVSLCHHIPFLLYNSMTVAHTIVHTQSSIQWDVIFCTRWEASFTTLVIGTRSLDRPARSESLCRLSYFGPLNDEHDLRVFAMFLRKISDQSGRKEKETVLIRTCMIRVHRRILRDW